MKTKLDSRLSATLYGSGALFFWALSPLLIYLLRPIPVFQLSAMAFGIAFLLIAARLTYYKNWEVIWKQPSYLFFLGLVLIFCNHVSYIAAIKWIPPEQAEIIYYLWPIMLLGFSAFVLKEKKSWVTIVSACLGLYGIYVLLSGDEAFGLFSWDGIPGYLLTVFSAAMWAGYSLLARYHAELPLEMNGIWCGMSAVLCLAIHFFIEPTVIPTLPETAYLFIMGAGILTLSLFMWSYGLRFGYHDRLSVFSYVTPVLSVFLLVAADCCTFRVDLVYSSFLVFLGGSLSCLPNSFLKSK